MLLSTLPDLSGRTYDAIGVVFGTTTISGSNGKNGDVQNLGIMFNTIIQQASSMGADAIVDIKMTAPGADRLSGIVVVIGTAVKLR